MILIEKGYELLVKLLTTLKINGTLAQYLSELILILGLLIIAIGLYYLLKLIYLKGIVKLFSKQKKEWLKEILNSPIMMVSFQLIFIIIFFKVIVSLPLLYDLFKIILILYLTFITIRILNSFLNLINDLYMKYHKHAKDKPIKGLISASKFILFTIILIVAIANLIGQSPVYILTGLGAISAVLLLVFKDPLLGLVGGFQMAANETIKIGDWIEMPKYNADGEVIDISLAFVKVLNWDKTTVAIPTHLMASDAFINWRDILDKNARRLKKFLNIDINSVRFLSDEEIEEFKKVEIIKDYLTTRKKEIDNSNQVNNVDTTIEINGRRMTNLGLFRVYILEYLKKNVHIRKDMLLVVRQLQTTNNGIPLEIYAFINTPFLRDYEEIAADIFDHLIAAIGHFNLNIYQQPSGTDFKKQH